MTYGSYMKIQIKLTFAKIIKILFKSLGYEIDIRKLISSDTTQVDKLNLNIASGSYVIPGFKSLDMYSSHYYKSKKKFIETRIEYDLRNDDIPFANCSVDNIYISHAIEHVENEEVKKFINESFRVLKKGGVLRIACPDAEFLYAVSQFDNEYWKWRVPSLSNPKRYMTDWDKCNQYDYLMRELSTPRMRFYKNKIPDKVFDYDEVNNLSYIEFVDFIKKDIHFREEFPDAHINNWDYKRLENLGLEAGFKNILRSKYLGSVSETMRSRYFDKTCPQMSLYVEMIK